MKLFFDVRGLEWASFANHRRGAFWAILNMLRCFSKRRDVELEIIDSSNRNIYEIKLIVQEFGLAEYVHAYSKKEILLTYPRYKMKHSSKIVRIGWKILDLMQNAFYGSKIEFLGKNESGVYFTAGEFDRLPEDEKILRCAFVWDMIPYVVPELFGSKEHRFLKEIKGNPGQFDFYFTDSLSAKEDLARVAGVEEGKISVAYLGASNQTQSEIPAEKISFVLDKYCLSKNKYVFTVSSYEKRKNFERMAQAFVDAVNLTKRSDLKFVIIGHRQDKLRKSLDEMISAGLISRQDVEKYVIMLGYIPSEDISILSENALFMAYVSLYEGFGLPVLDSMKMGIPVLTSNVSSLPEVAGDAAITVDPYSVEEISKAMIRLMNDDSLRKNMVNKGKERAKLFTWESCVNRMVEDFECRLKEQK